MKNHSSLPAATLFLLFSLFIQSSAHAQYVNITPEAAYDRLLHDPWVVFLDVREIAEWNNYGHIPNALLMPVNSGVLASQHTSLPTGVDIIVYCQSGGRSASASNYLVTQGHTRIFNMTGGYGDFSSAYGDISESIGADLNGDKVVDSKDLLLFTAQWGSTSTDMNTPTPTSTVPTPTVVLTLTPTPTPTCPTQSGVITGKILDEEGDGLANYVVSTVLDATPPANQSDTTDGNGNYALNDVPPGHFALYLREPGTRQWMARQDPANSNNDTQVMASGTIAACSEININIDAPLQIYYTLDANGNDSHGGMVVDAGYVVLAGQFDSSDGLPQFEEDGDFFPAILENWTLISSQADVTIWEPWNVPLPQFPFWRIQITAPILSGAYDIRLKNGSRVSNEVRWTISSP